MSNGIHNAHKKTYAASAQAQFQARLTTGQGLMPSASTRNSGNTIRITHSVSAPKHADIGSLEPSASDFPPVSAMQTRKLPLSSQPLLNMENVQAANRSLVEKIPAPLEYDEDKYTAFKDISGQYQRGLIDTRGYLESVEQYGLSHLVLDLARLCPDPQKQKELVETYNVLQGNNQLQNGWSKSTVQWKDANGSKKGEGKSVVAGDSNGSKNGKGKSVAVEDGNSKDTLVNSIIFKPKADNVEVLTKDGYRSAKGKSKAMVNEQLRGQNDSSSAGCVSGQTSVDGGGGGKQRKKTSKFHGVRLGDGSMAAHLDLKNTDPGSDSEPLDNRLDGNQNLAEGLPVRGVWRNGGGHKLFS